MKCIPHVSKGHLQRPFGNLFCNFCVPSEEKLIFTWICRIGVNSALQWFSYGFYQPCNYEEAVWQVNKWEGTVYSLLKGCPGWTALRSQHLQLFWLTLTNLRRAGLSGPGVDHQSGCRWIFANRYLYFFDHQSGNRLVWIEVSGLDWTQVLITAADILPSICAIESTWF